MTNDREAQVRKLQDAIRKCRALEYLPEDLYDAGARIPDPPPPRLPVVSDRAVVAMRDNARIWAHISPGYSDGMIAAGLHAAFAVILEDTAAAVATDHPQYGRTVEIRSSPYSAFWVPPELLLATLTGKAP